MLIDVSSAEIFRRGQQYAAAEAVEVVEEHPMPEPALSATVVGNKAYHTEVWIENDAIAGQCDCPHAAD